MPSIFIQYKKCFKFKNSFCHSFCGRWELSTSFHEFYQISWSFLELFDFLSDLGSSLLIVVILVPGHCLLKDVNTLNKFHLLNSIQQNIESVFKPTLFKPFYYADYRA